MAMVVGAIILSICALLVTIYVMSLKRLNPSKRLVEAGLTTFPVVGNLPGFMKNRGRLLEWQTAILREQPTSTFTFWRPGNIRGVITANPANVEYILKTNFDNYPKGHRFISLFQDFLGLGIFNSDGHIWKVQRKTASFEFNTKSLRNFVVESVRLEILNRLFPVLEQASKTNHVLDLQDVLERFAFDNVCKVAFNVDPMCLSESGCAQTHLSADFAYAFEAAASLSVNRFRSIFPDLWRLRRLLNLGSERDLKRHISIVHNFAMQIIRSRKKDAADMNVDTDLLSRFIANADISDEFLRDIIISFILAGRDTTSSSLAWFFWLISKRPDVVQNILSEVKTMRDRYKNPNDVLGFEELREMHYLHATISESLRLYPPVALDTKFCDRDDKLPDGTVVKKGWFVTYNSYAMGRMEGIWGKNCEEYVPERWLENGTYRAENVYRFPVFHAGPRMCLGREMAYIQMKSIVAGVLERFEIDVLDKDTCPEKMLSLTLRMNSGLPIRVRERCY